MAGGTSISSRSGLVSKEEDWYKEEAGTKTQSTIVDQSVLPSKKDVAEPGQPLCVM